MVIKCLRVWDAVNIGMLLEIQAAVVGIGIKCPLKDESKFQCRKACAEDNLVLIKSFFIHRMSQFRGLLCFQIL